MTPKVCESVEVLDVLSSVPVTVATDEYLRDDRPFLVTDAMQDWPVMNTDDFWFDNITEVTRNIIIIIIIIVSNLYQELKSKNTLALVNLHL